jgi:integrase
VNWERTGQPGIYKRDGTRGRAYRVFYRDAADVQHSRNFKTWQEAKYFKARVSQRRPDATVRGALTLGQVYEHQAAERQYAEETLSVRRSAWKHLERYAGRPIDKITPRIVDEILAPIKAKPGMHRKVRSLLSTLMGYAIEKNWITSNPVSRPPKKRTRAEKLADRPQSDGKKYLSNEELARFEDAIAPRYAAMVELMARVGLRPGEAMALTVGKFDPLRRTLVIDTSLSGFTKTGESRTLTLPSPIVETLVEHLARFSDPRKADALMFTTDHGYRLNPERFRSHAWLSACRQSGIDLTPNQLRHTAASFAISTGANVYDVMKMLGHSKASITLDTYAELFEGQHDRFVDKYGEAILAARSSVR